MDNNHNIQSLVKETFSVMDSSRCEIVAKTIMGAGVVEVRDLQWLALGS